MVDKIVHFEIPADNMERAQTLYSKAFGWQANSMPDMEYTMLCTVPSDKNGMPTEPGAINGGKRQDPVKSPVIAIGVADVDSSL